jgi:hypothetical protein
MSNEDLVAEVSRLRRLVEDAWAEGFEKALREGGAIWDPEVNQSWKASASFRKLNPEDKS